jgi:hypothetical protein
MLLAGLFLSQGKNAVLWFLVGLGLAARNLRTGGDAARTAEPHAVAIALPQLMR